MKVDFVEKESGDSFCSDNFLSGAKNHPLCKPMVNHDQERVKTRGGQQVSDKVTRDLLERARGKEFDRSERWNSGVCTVAQKTVHIFDYFALNALFHTNP